MMISLTPKLNKDFIVLQDNELWSWKSIGPVFQGQYRSTGFESEQACIADAIEFLSPRSH